MNSGLSPKAAEIAQLARALLARGGYNGFSYADISDAVGISKASIHHHFPSKAGLVRNVVALYREETQAGLHALSREVDDPLAQIEAYANYWTQCIHDNSLPLCICAMLAAEMPTLPPEVAAEVQGHFHELSAWLASVFEIGAGRGRFHLQGSAAAEAKTFMATVHGAMLAARAFGHPETFQNIVRPAIARLTTAD